MNTLVLLKKKVLNYLYCQLKKYELPFFVVLFIVLICNVTMLYFMHEPWRDEAQAWLLVRDNNLFGLLSQLKYDGHPSLWYILNFPIVKLRLPFDTLRIFHGIIVIACFFIICFCLKCYPLLRIALALGTLLPSEFSMYSRNYAIGILLMLLLTIWYDRRFTSRKIHCAICLLLLANTNTYAAVVPIALLCSEVFLALYTMIIEKQTPYVQEERLGVGIFYSGAIAALPGIFGSPSNICRRRQDNLW